MARLGRGQAFAPIFLRTATAVVAAAALAAPLHVISLASYRLPRPVVRRAGVIFLSPNGRSVVPDRLPPRLTIVGQAVERAAVRIPRTTTVRILRAPQAQAAAAFVRPRLVVVSLAPHRARQIQRDGAVVFSRTAATAAPQVQAAPQVTIVSLTPRRHGVVRRTAVLWVRPNVASIGPARLAPQVHVVSRVGDRVRVRRAPMLLFRRTAAEGAPTVSELLLVVDQGGARYLVLDQGTGRYAVDEDGGVRLDVVDRADTRYDVEDDGMPRYEVDP